MGTEENIINTFDIEDAKEKYDELAEEFLDAVFDTESKLTRHDWEKEVASK